MSKVRKISKRHWLFAGVVAAPNAQRGRWLCIALILLAAELFAVIYNLVI